MPLPNLYIAPDANDQLVWTLDESASPWANSGQLGALNMATHAAGSVPVTGLYTKAVQFPGGVGSGKYIDTGAAGTSLGEYTTAITLSCFVFPTLFDNTNYQVICQKAYRPDASGSTSPFSGIELYIAPNASTTVGVFGCALTVGGVQFGVTFFGLPINQWSHVGVTFDNATIRLYLNGVLVNSVAQVGPIDYGTHGAWQVGNDAGFGAPFVGTVDDVRVANVARPLTYFQAFGGPQYTSVANMTPAPGAIAAAQTIAFDVTSNAQQTPVASSLFAYYPVTGVREIIHDGTAFGPNYKGVNNTIAAIYGGFHYTVLRDGGWISSSVQLQVSAVDEVGS